MGGGTVDTGVPPSIAAQWILKKKVKHTGAIPPEIAFDPLPYFKDLNSQGRGIVVTEYAETTKTLN